MQALLALSRAIDWLNAFIGKYSIWLIFAATFISAANAVVRKVFDTSSNVFLEVQWYLFAWSFPIAAGWALLNREHVRIDVVNSPCRTRRGCGLMWSASPSCSRRYASSFCGCQCRWCCRCTARARCRATPAG